MAPDLGPPIPVEVHTKGPPRRLPVSPWRFPDASEAPATGLLAVGADFEPPTVVAAYRAGAFPWPHPDEEYLWFSPDPRAVLPYATLHVSRSLARTIRRGGFRVTVDAAFDQVIEMCSTIHPDTWITPNLEDGYRRLHRLGWAHSCEVWTPGGVLAGGLYGVGVGALFGAESMFHVERDASKVAVVAMVQHAQRIGVGLIDIQVLNPHTASLGGVEIPRAEYLRAVRALTTSALDWSVAPGGARGGR